MFRNNVPCYSRQQGSVLIVGIFIITVMFFLAAALIKVVDNADEDVTLEVWGIRAFTAANSGVEAGLAKLFPLGQPAEQTCNGIAGNWPLPPVRGFSGCKVTLGCQLATVTFQGQDIKQFTLTSNAVCESGFCDANASSDSQCLRVNRQVEVMARVD